MHDEYHAAESYEAAESLRQRREAEAFQRIMDRVLLAGFTIILLLLIAERWLL